jgi:predicted nuclease with TOPRIM domain
MEKNSEIEQLQKMVEELMETKKADVNLRSKLKELQKENDTLREQVKRLRIELNDK